MHISVRSKAQANKYINIYKNLPKNNWDEDDTEENPFRHRFCFLAFQHSSHSAHWVDKRQQFQFEMRAYWTKLSKYSCRRCLYHLFIFSHPVPMHCYRVHVAMIFSRNIIYETHFVLNLVLPFWGRTEDEIELVCSAELESNDTTWWLCEKLYESQNLNFRVSFLSFHEFLASNRQHHFPHMMLQIWRMKKMYFLVSRVENWVKDDREQLQKDVDAETWRQKETQEWKNVKCALKSSRFFAFPSSSPSEEEAIFTAIFLNIFILANNGKNFFFPLRHHKQQHHNEEKQQIRHISMMIIRWMCEKILQLQSRSSIRVNDDDTVGRDVTHCDYELNSAKIISSSRGSLTVFDA